MANTSAQDQSASSTKSSDSSKSSGDEGRLGSRDRLTDIKAAQGPLQPTATDAMGVERIVGPAVDDNWSPAPVDPDPEAIAHREAVAAADKARREERLGATQVSASNLGGTEAAGRDALAAQNK